MGNPKNIIKIGKGLPHAILGPGSESSDEMYTGDKDKVLMHDIVIPAGTIFKQAPVKTERCGPGIVQHTIGLTNDSFGDLTYYIDQDDPEIRHWFADVDEGLEKAIESGGNIIMIDNRPTTIDIPPDRVLEAAKGKLKRALVIGLEIDGENFYFCSSTSSKKECLWLIDNFKNQLLNGFKDMEVYEDEE